MDQQLVFGFLPAPVLQNINELGNWKTRSHAIEQLQRGLASLGPAQNQVLLQQLPQFVAFLQQMLQDHNFKVVSAGLNVLADSCSSLGTALQQHMGDLVPILLTKLLDHRAQVASAALKAAANLMQHTHPNNPPMLVNRLLQLLQQQQQSTSSTPAPGQDFSAVLELIILALIKGPISSLDLPAATRLLLACLPQHSSSSSDSSPRSSKQQALAMEAFALATDSVGAQLPNLLKQAGSSDLNVTQVLTQVQQLQRPVLAADGSLQHNSSVQAAIAAVEAAATTHSGSSLLIGAAGMYDRNSNISTSSFRSDSSMGGRPLSASSQASGQQQQMLPPGSLGALAAHAQLISSAASSIAAAAATSRGGGSAADTSVDATGRLSSSGGAGSSSRPASSLMADPSCHGSPLPDGRHCNVVPLQTAMLGSPRACLGHSISISSTSRSSHHLQPTGDGQLESPGSPKWQQEHRQVPSSPKQTQQVQMQLSKLQLYDSSNYAPHRHDLRLPQDAAGGLEEAAAISAASRRDSSAAGSQSIRPHELPAESAAAAGAIHNLRYQQSHGGIQSSGGGLPQWDTAEQAHSSSPDASGAGLLVGAAGVASGGRSNWRAAAGPGWAASDDAGSDASQSSPRCSGRIETLSPSRGERLANLKRRQVEKRAVSATGSTRGSFPWDSQEGALPAAAGAAAAGAAAAGAEEYGMPRASTAGPAPATALGGWRLSSTAESMSGQAGCVQASYGHCSSPTPADGIEQAASPTRVAPLLQWHIPTGPGGCLLPPGAAAKKSLQHSSSPEPAGTAQLKPSTSNLSTASWDSAAGSSSLSGRPFRSNAAASSGAHAGQLLQYAPRTVSAAAVLTSTAAADSGSRADGSGGASSAGGLQPRSSRFQNTRCGSLSPGGVDSGSGAACLIGTSRLQGNGNNSNSCSSSSGVRMQQAEQEQQQQKRSMGPGNAAGLGSSSTGSYRCSQTAATPTGEYSSNPGSRLISASVQAGTGSSSGSAGTGAAVPGPSGSPTRSAAGGLSSRAGGGLRLLLGGDRPQSVGSAEADPFGPDLSPLADPEAALGQAVSRLQQANSATRKEVDWQAQLDALLDARRLLAHHPEVLRTSARELVLAALPTVDDLRSTTSRMALLFFQELPASGLSIERELDEVVPVLLKKAGDLSTAGRDNFLAQESDKALSVICASVSESRALSALIAAGAGHKSPHVRSRAAAHLDEVAAGGKGLEPLLRSGNWPLLDRLFKTAAAFLQEGSLDARTYGKRLLWAVKTVLRGIGSDMARLMTGISPEAVQRRVVEVLEGLSAPPPAPTSRGSSSAGPRLASRGQSSVCSTPTSMTGIQPVPPYSAPPASLYNIGGTAATGQDSPNFSSRSGCSSIGSSSNGSSMPRRALFSNASSAQAAAATAGPGGSPGSPIGSPTLSSSASRRRRSTVSGLADGSSSRGQGSSAAASSGSGSPAGVGGSCGAFGCAGSSSGGNDRRLSGGCPAGPAGPMSPALQEAVDQVGMQLCSKDWRNRMDALRALSALGPALPEVPNAALDGLLQALIGRLSDGNAKVNQKALEVLIEVVCIINLRTLLIMTSLMPALTANLGSTNDKLRGCASAALDAVAAVVSPQPLLLMQGLAQAIANGSVRTKLSVVEKLNMILPAMHSTQPQLTRLLLPAAFSLALEARGEAKAAAAQLLSGLAALLGSSAVLSAAAVVSSATEQRVRDLMLGTASRS